MFIIENEPVSILVALPERIHTNDSIVPNLIRKTGWYYWHINLVITKIIDYI